MSEQLLWCNRKSYITAPCLENGTLLIATITAYLRHIACRNQIDQLEHYETLYILSQLRRQHGTYQHLPLMQSGLATLT
jgi:hypothetical protein